MKKCKITAIRITEYKDLMDEYEIPQEIPCTIKQGDVFISEDGKIPPGFCSVAWDTIKPFVHQLLYANERVYGNWMKNPKSAMISCNDGFRPVSFLIEVI